MYWHQDYNIKVTVQWAVVGGRARHSDLELTTRQQFYP